MRIHATKLIDVFHGSFGEVLLSNVTSRIQDNLCSAGNRPGPTLIFLALKKSSEYINGTKTLISKILHLPSSEKSKENTTNVHLSQRNRKSVNSLHGQIGLCFILTVDNDMMDDLETTE